MGYQFVDPEMTPEVFQDYLFNEFLEKVRLLIVNNW